MSMFPISPKTRHFKSSYLLSRKNAGIAGGWGFSRIGWDPKIGGMNYNRGGSYISPNCGPDLQKGDFLSKKGTTFLTFLIKSPLKGLNAL